jgi:hypothetical protein
MCCEGREKTMCDSRFWLLRGLVLEAQQQLQYFLFPGALLVGIVGLNDGYLFFVLFLIVVLVLI